MISVQFNNILWMKWKKLYEVEQSSIMSKFEYVKSWILEMTRWLLSET